MCYENARESRSLYANCDRYCHSGEGSKMTINEVLKARVLLDYTTFSGDEVITDLQWILLLYFLCYHSWRDWRSLPCYGRRGVGTLKISCSSSTEHHSHQHVRKLFCFVLWLLKAGISSTTAYLGVAILPMTNTKLPWLHSICVMLKLTMSLPSIINSDSEFIIRTEAWSTSLLLFLVWQLPATRSTLDTILRDQLAKKAFSSRMRDRLLEGCALTLDKAIQIAVQVEKCQCDVHLMSGDSACVQQVQRTTLQLAGKESFHSLEMPSKGSAAACFG